MVEVARKKIALNLPLLLTNFCASATFDSQLRGGAGNRTRVLRD